MTGTETTNTTPPFQEVEGTLSSEEENPEVSFSSEEETATTDESEDQFEGEGSSETLPPRSSLVKEEQGKRTRRRGRTRQRARGVGRVRETKTLLASHTYCSHAKMQWDIKSLLHLGPSGRDEELNFTNFDKCTDPRVCGTQRGSAGTADRCTGCTVRQTGSGFSPCSTGKRLRSFKMLCLRLRGDRTGMRSVLGDRVLQHPWPGLLKVQTFRAAWQQGTAAKFYGTGQRRGLPGLGTGGRGTATSGATRTGNLAHGNQGKEPLGTTIFLLVIDGNRGPNGRTARRGLERGGGPGPAPGVVI